MNVQHGNGQILKLIVNQIMTVVNVKNVTHGVLPVSDQLMNIVTFVLLLKIKFYCLCNQILTLVYLHVQKDLIKISLKENVNFVIPHVKLVLMLVMMENVFLVKINIV